MDWLLSKVSALFAPKYIGAVVRAILVALGGFLVQLGIPSEQVEALTAALDPVLAGAISIGLGLVWSLIQKKNHSK